MFGIMKIIQMNGAGTKNTIIYVPTAKASPQISQTELNTIIITWE